MDNGGFKSHDNKYTQKAKQMQEEEGWKCILIIYTSVKPSKDRNNWAMLKNCFNAMAVQYQNIASQQ